MNFILTWLGQLLGGPFIKAALDAYRAKLDAGNNSEKIAADLASRELEVQQRELEVQGQIRIAQVGKWYTVENLAGYTIVLYMAKCYLWDAAFHMGSTDSVDGSVGEWGALVIIFFFGKRGIENVARILRK